MARTGSGRKSKPRALKELAGNPGKRSLGRDLDAPPQEELEAAKSLATATLAPPTWLNKTAAKEWKRLAPILQRLRLLGQVDASALAQYCMWWGVWSAAAQAVNRIGSTYKTKSKHGSIDRVRPQFAVLEKAQRMMNRLSTEFGLTPAARSSLGRALVDPANQPELGLPTPAGADRPRDPRPLSGSSPINFLN